MMDDWDYLVDKQIQDAIDKGKFENLPGKGKPIEWDENPFADPDHRAAYHLLKKHGFTLPWIAERQEIEADLDAARRSLLRTWKWCGCDTEQMLPGQMYEWERALGDFKRTIIGLNDRIKTLNLKVPSAEFQRLPIVLDREIEILTQGGMVS
jgi:DnaJ family protein C protein 28